MPGNEIYDIPGQHGLTIIPTPIRLDAMEGRVLRLHEVEIALCYCSMLCTESRRNIIVAQLKDEFHRRGVASYSTIRDDG